MMYMASMINKMAMIQRKKKMVKKFLVHWEGHILQQRHRCMDSTGPYRNWDSHVVPINRTPWNHFMLSVLLARTLSCRVRPFFLIGPIPKGKSTKTLWEDISKKNGYLHRIVSHFTFTFYMWNFKNHYYASLIIRKARVSLLHTFKSFL